MNGFSFLFLKTMYFLPIILLIPKFYRKIIIFHIHIFCALKVQEKNCLLHISLKWLNNCIWQNIYIGCHGNLLLLFVCIFSQFLSIKTLLQTIKHCISVLLCSSNKAFLIIFQCRQSITVNVGETPAN